MSKEKGVREEEKTRTPKSNIRRPDEKNHANSSGWHRVSHINSEIKKKHASRRAILKKRFIMTVFKIPYKRTDVNLENFLFFQN